MKGILRSLVLGLASLSACGAVVADAAAPMAGKDPHAGVFAWSQTKGTISNFIDFTPRGTQPGLDHPLLGSGSCGGCHGGSELETHYPRNSWSGSMMANATRDPLFWAALDVANADGAANGAPGIGDYCLRCHTPSGWYGGRVRKLQDVTVQEGMVDSALVVDGTDGCMLKGDHDDSDGLENDYGGIGCHTCHRLLAVGPQGEAGFLENGDAWIDDIACAGSTEPCRGGPYNDYPTVELAAPPHAWEYSAHQSSSEACGTCHDVTTPVLESGPFRTLILDNGTLAGNDTGLPFPAERTFSEWKASDFATVLFRDGLENGGAAIPGKRLAQGETCQGCHMPQAEQPVPAQDLKACTFGPPRQGNLRVHEFAGGNTWIPAILNGELPNLLASVGGSFANTIDWATAMLSERSALVETTAQLAGATTLQASVKVTNLTGHKLPTGYAEGRRMWLAVEVRDEADQLIWSNGGWNAATGDLAIDAQTRIYEIKQGIWDAATGDCATRDAQDREHFHFVLNNCIAKDNRIPPLGFRGAHDPEMAPYGYTFGAAPGIAGATANFDVVPYTIALPPNANFPLTVRATLRYQLASKDYVTFLRDQAVERGFAAENTLCAGEEDRPFVVGPQNKSRGQYIYDLWNSPSYGRSPPVNMATASAVVAP